MTEKPFWASRTIWANGLAAIAAVALAFGFDLGFTPEAQAQILTGIMAIVNIVLRLTTTQPIKRG